MGGTPMPPAPAGKRGTGVPPVGLVQTQSDIGITLIRYV
jgi:hypothetical protein